ncbi:MAG TPA: DUF952 domain-containing protein [Gemmataceae bacterium]|jgi:uncharacterized protein (DUF952 family)
MSTIYHLALSRVWEQNAAEPYRADSLTSEGFIHCSFAKQVTWAANRFYAEAVDLLVLHIDPKRLSSPVREEACETGEIFPHIYGPVNREAVLKVEKLTRGADGRWQFSGS